MCWRQSFRVPGAGVGGGGRSPLLRGLEALGVGVRSEGPFSWGEAHVPVMARRWGMGEDGTLSDLNTALFSL